MTTRYDPLTALVGKGRRLYLGAGPHEAPVTMFLSAVLASTAVGMAVSAVASGRGMKIE